MSRIGDVDARLFHIPLKEVLADAKHGEHTYFELLTVTVTLDNGQQITSAAGETSGSVDYTHAAYDDVYLDASSISAAITVASDDTKRSQLCTMKVGDSGVNKYGIVG